MLKNNDIAICHNRVLQILVIEGLHPFYDDRVRDLVDFKVYLDISDEIKFAWKIQRDMAERGHSLESIKKSIEARKPDFDAYIDPQKKHADMIIQVSEHVHKVCPLLLQGSKCRVGVCFARVQVGVCDCFINLTGLSFHSTSYSCHISYASSC